MKTTIQIATGVLHLLSNSDFSPDEIAQELRKIIMQDRVEQHEATLRSLQRKTGWAQYVSFESTQED